MNIIIEVDDTDPHEYRLTVPLMSLQDFWTIIADIKTRIEEGEFDPGQTEHLELLSSSIKNNDFDN